MSELPDWVVEPLKRVLGDMRVSPDKVRFDGEYVWGSLGADRIALWIGYQGERGDELTMMFADTLQNDVSETAAHWGEAVPPCPGHAHPLDTSLLDGEAWWVCPADHRRVAKIGRLWAPAYGSQ